MWAQCDVNSSPLPTTTMTLFIKLNAQHEAVWVRMEDRYKPQGLKGGFDVWKEVILTSICMSIQTNWETDPDPIVTC